MGFLTDKPGLCLSVICLHIGLLDLFYLVKPSLHIPFFSLDQPPFLDISTLSIDPVSLLLCASLSIHRYCM